MALGEGDVLGGYRIDRLIGRGGMGAVYLAHDDQLPVALKVLAPETAEIPAVRERFVGEARLVASLDHPHILPIYEAGEADGQLFIAMRYVPGPDLAGLIARDGPLPLERTVALIEQVASALDAAHAAGLIHRDVKPGNILIEPGVVRGTDHAYLTDFGFGIQAEYVGSPVALGSRGYMAPEQIEKLTLDGRADVYALGCVLYACLAGTPPFARDSWIVTLDAQLWEPPPEIAVRAGLPRAVNTVIARAMAKTPAERYPTAGELARVLSIGSAWTVAYGRVGRSRNALLAHDLLPRLVLERWNELHGWFEGGYGGQVLRGLWSKAEQLTGDLSEIDDPGLHVSSVRLREGGGFLVSLPKPEHAVEARFALVPDWPAPTRYFLLERGVNSDRARPGWVLTEWRQSGDHVTYGPCGDPGTEDAKALQAAMVSFVAQVLLAPLPLNAADPSSPETGAVPSVLEAPVPRCAHCYEPIGDETYTSCIACPHVPAVHYRCLQAHPARSSVHAETDSRSAASVMGQTQTLAPAGMEQLPKSRPRSMVRLFAALGNRRRNASKGPLVPRVIEHRRVDTADPAVRFQIANFQRTLMVRGKPTCMIGLTCETCAWFFDALASSPLSPAALSDRLAGAVDLFDADLLATVDQLLPPDDYAVADLLVRPTLTVPGAADDYFGHESLDLFGGPIYDPGRSYWRTPGRVMGGDASSPLFHFLIPLQRPDKLRPERVAYYERALDRGSVPAALGVSVLDRRSPPSSPGPDVGPRATDALEHWTLATYLLDGHHKTAAAASRCRPLRLLTYIARTPSVASEEDVAAVLSDLTRSD